MRHHLVLDDPLFLFRRFRHAFLSCRRLWHQAQDESLDPFRVSTMPKQPSGDAISHPIPNVTDIRSIIDESKYHVRFGGDIKQGSCLL